jgi:hypothetical protein
MIVVATIVLFAAPVFDHGWLARTHWLAAAFDYATTGNVINECPRCHEQDPLSRPFIGMHPQPFRLAIGWTAECAAVSFIPNRRVRRIVQIGAIGAHVFFGARNLERWH